MSAPPEDEDVTVPLRPVSEWVYSLARVEYREREDGPIVLQRFIAYTSDDGLVFDILEDWPFFRDGYYAWVRVAEEIPHPRVIGSIYGQSIHESPQVHGSRIAAEMGLS